MCATQLRLYYRLSTGGIRKISARRGEYDFPIFQAARKIIESSPAPMIRVPKKLMAGSNLISAIYKIE